MLGYIPSFSVLSRVFAAESGVSPSSLRRRAGCAYPNRYLLHTLTEKPVGSLALLHIPVVLVEGVVPRAFSGGLVVVVNEALVFSLPLPGYPSLGDVSV